MTGKREVVFAQEKDGYLSSPSGDLIYPGTDVEVSELSLNNALTRMRLPDDNQTYRSLAQNFEGALSVSFTPTNPWWLTNVFGNPPTAGGESSAPYSYTWTPAFGPVQSSRWYTGVDLAANTIERELKGVVFPQMSVSYSQGQPVTVDLTGLVGDEQQNSSFEQDGSTVVGGSGNELMFHGFSLTIPSGGDEVKRVQEATLNISMGTRFQRGPQRKPVDAVSGAVTTDLTFQKIIEDATSQVTLAYGNSTAPATGDVDGAATGKMDLTTAGDHAQKWDLTQITPDEYAWTDLVNYDADVLEDLTCYVDQVSVTAESSKSTAP